MKKPIVNISEIEARHPGIQLEDGIRGLTWEQVNKEVYAKNGELYFRKGFRAGKCLSDYAHQLKDGYLRHRMLGVPGLLHRWNFFYHLGWLPEGDRKKLKPGKIFYVIHHEHGERHLHHIGQLKCVTISENSSSKKRWKDPAYKARLVEIHKERWTDPRLKARFSESIRATYRAKWRRELASHCWNDNQHGIDKMQRRAVWRTHRDP